MHESFSDDPETVGPPPDQLDRLWRHPSEMGALPRPSGFATVARPGLGALAALGIVSAVVGSLLTVGILGLSGLLSGRPTPTAKDRLLVASTDDARKLAAARVSPSIVEVVDPLGTTPHRGAGVCITHDGLILTVAALVQNARTVQLIQSDGTGLTGTVLGIDRESGLALVQADAELPAASLADHAPGTSQTVIVIGANHTIGEGIVNATQTVRDARSGIDLARVIVTDAQPRLPLAGSALVDRFGQVAGIVLPGEAGAVPIEYARAVADRMQAGTMQRAWLGLHTGDTPNGPIVTATDARSPAATVGIVVGDAIVGVDSRRTETTGDFDAAVRSHWLGDSVVVTVIHDGVQRDFTMTAQSLDPLRAPTTTTTTGG